MEDYLEELLIINHNDDDTDITDDTFYGEDYSDL